MSALFATDTVVVRATGSCVSTPVLVAMVDTSVADLATDLDESVRDSIIESTVVSIDDFALITSSFVGTATNSVGLVAADFVVLSATGSLHIEQITV
ncbi:MULTISPECIES: hypothetical protein [unclassified Lysinibacillus]|uniref:hypothetical protein n=1 Tax=unclassified Lysinibacillus TaxID=2636778 RepID=UPI0030F53D0B